MRRLILLIVMCFVVHVMYAQKKKVVHKNSIVSVKKRLIGKWTSNEDPIFTLQVFKDHIIQFNKGEDDSDYFKYEVTAIPCDTTEAQRSKTGFYLNEVSKDGLTTCSYIEKLTADSLLLNYNWGAKLLHFARKRQKRQGK